MRIATLVVVALMASFVAVSAQTPYIAVYFDPGHSQETKDCPGPSMDTWYVAALNFNTFLSGAEFAISYPPVVTWLADPVKPAVSIGQTPTGISMGFPEPVNGFVPVDLCQVQVFWNCNDCNGWANSPVRVIAHPATMFLGCTDYPGFNLIPAVGLTAMLCQTPPVPVQETTWGQIKATYGE